jgi:hypothetical protein
LFFYFQAPFVSVPSKEVNNRQILDEGTVIEKKIAHSSPIECGFFTLSAKDVLSDAVFGPRIAFFFFFAFVIYRISKFD